MPGISQKGQKGFQSADTVQGSDHVWNTGKQFAFIKIMKLLSDLDVYESIAQYGTADMNEIIEGPSLICRRRYEAMERLASTERMLIGNANFAFKKGDRPEVKYCQKLIEEVVRPNLGRMMVHLSDEISNTSELKINEAVFQRLFKYLIEVKDKLNVFLNRAGLIFRESEETDLNAIQDSITSGGM
jgi:hypothetical protein